jgi:hypothetical protein
MRDFERPGRSEALGASGMAATSHPLATMIAFEVLRNGGNAIDAAVATVALLGDRRADADRYRRRLFCIADARRKGERYRP